MPRFLCLRLSLCGLALLTCASATQQLPGQIPDSGQATVSSSEIIISLLQQSHEVNSQLPAYVQYSLLREQVDLATEVQPELARQYANELFHLAGQAKGPARAQGQDFAMAILARLDSDRALELLHTMDTNGSDATPSSPFSAHAALVRQAFEVLVERDGEAALPIIEREANFIGTNGTYPYSAVGDAASKAVSKDWAQNKDHAIQMQESVLDQMLARYSATPHTYFGDIEFGEMLKTLSAGLPLESISPALHLLVNNLLDTDTTKYQYHAAVYTSDGKSAKADNAIDAALMQLVTLICRDPELTQGLQSTRPELRDALEGAKNVHIRFGSFGGRVGPPLKPQPVDPLKEAELEAVRFAHVQPDVAIAKAEAIPPSPERTRALLQIAQALSGLDPAKVTRLIAEAGQQADAESQVAVISVMASAAAANRDQAELHRLLQSGFDLATRSLSEHPQPFMDGLGSLVQTGIQEDPALTTVFLQSLPPSQAKAHLLLSAAQALKLQRRARPARGAEQR